MSTWEPKTFWGSVKSFIAANPGSMTTAMIAKPTQGSAPSFFAALYATINGRKTNTPCQHRLMNCQVGESWLASRGSAQLGMTLSVLINAMKVMNSEAPSSAPRIGRNESDRNSKNESIPANLPRGPLARAAALIASASAPSPPDPIPGSALMSL